MLRLAREMLQYKMMRHVPFINTQTKQNFSIKLQFHITSIYALLSFVWFELTKIN